MWLKIFWYKVFVHSKLTLFSFLVDSVLINFTVSISNILGAPKDRYMSGSASHSYLAKVKHA